MKMNILKRRSIIIIGFFLVFLIITPAVFAASTSFLSKATEYYQRSCTGNVNHIPSSTATLCYLFDKVSELDQDINNLDSRLDSIEAINANQSAKIAELEQRIAALEKGTSQTTYIISDATWRFSNTEVSGWLNANFDDSSWIFTQAPSGGQCAPSAIGLQINEHGALPMSVNNPNWEGGSGYFRKTFNLSRIPSSASVRVILDDDGDLYINGNLVLSDHDNQIAGIQQANISTSYLVNGVNAIGLKVVDSVGVCQWAQVEITLNP